ncbi:MAG TPA: hypothetical protein K8V78_00725 [Lacrimispora saccharolytica]|nr:hypothetical protein [Lacrimispora saccharolytica]
MSSKRRKKKKIKGNKRKLKEIRETKRKQKETDKGSKGHSPKRTGRNYDRQRA